MRWRRLAGNPWWAAVCLVVAAWVAASRFWLQPALALEPGRTFRIHVFAASDRPADQEVKRAVRLALVAYLLRREPAALWSRDPEEVERRLQRHREAIGRLVREVLRRMGAPPDARVELGPAWLGARRLGPATVPAGRYRALVVRIGPGDGGNWWCVAFPPTCLSPRLVWEWLRAPAAVREPVEQALAVAAAAPAPVDAPAGVPPRVAPPRPRAAAEQPRPPVEVRLRILDWLRDRTRGLRAVLALH